MMIATSIIPSPFGNIELMAEGDVLNVCRRTRKHVTAGRATPVLKEAAKQLDAYFKRQLTVFDIPVYQHGTLLQMKMWETIQTIPYGSTWSYKQLAQAAGYPKAARAAGAANARCEIWIIVPCHRVISASGALGGYGGESGLKQKLLDIEKRSIPIAILP